MAGDLDLLIGTWTVRVKGWTWQYDFRAGGVVSWRDLGSAEHGTGNWAASSTLVNMWWKGSSTRESWQRPLTNSSDHTWYESSYYRGKYRIEKNGAVAPAPSPTPSAPTEADIIETAWNASRSSLRFALSRLRLLERQIDFLIDSLGDQAAFDMLWLTYRRDIAVIARLLLVPANPMDDAFRDALAKSISMLDQNLALPKALNAAHAGGKCADPRSAFAWTTPGRKPPDTDLCNPWFSANAELKRDVITHEYFHTIGCADIEVNTTAEAFRNANTMAQLVAFLHDRARQQYSDGHGQMVPPLPTP
ncbi:hypothetical protein [Bosea sp. (in: a-proteobacteria)]|uniref:hypothetical protein n=1 Tax=Bosea sp. (in: a-proteobacteria) TaxID=1871050 RepID=UPI0025BAE501|nr:hypothetical protein [Bosea sp. (in: a-proteobacteria)]MBR3189336.1 hypothetical protein [Bosea sp. (in: a-proteobacteria)]